MGLKPTTNCCGCFTLLGGVQAVCLWTLLCCVLTICLVSSAEPIVMSGLVISPNLQVLMGTWAFFGIPVSIGAGVGALYRIELPVQLLFFFQCVTFGVSCFIPLLFLLSGSLCDAMVDKAMQRMGSSVVCGFIDTFWLFWLGLMLMIQLYVVYVIWSCCEDISENPYPELERYREALASVKAPMEPEKVPIPERRAVPGAAIAVKQPALLEEERYPRSPRTDMSRLVGAPIAAPNVGPMHSQPVMPASMMAGPPRTQHVAGQPPSYTFNPYGSMN